MINADYWIKKLGLKRHPEGGHYMADRNRLVALYPEHRDIIEKYT